MNTIISLVVSGVGCYMLYSGYVNNGNEKVVIGSVITLVGLSQIMYDYFTYVKNAVLHLVPKFNKTDIPVNQTVDTNQDMFTPQPYEYKDMECLTYLKRRCEEAGSEEGITKTNELCAIIFNLPRK